MKGEGGNLPRATIKYVRELELGVGGGDRLRGRLSVQASRIQFAKFCSLPSWKNQHHGQRTPTGVVLSGEIVQRERV